MQYGIREICNVVFKAKNVGHLGSYKYVPGQPVLYIDSAKTSTLEGAASTSYATGGRGNSRLIAWEGEKTLTFTVEDALLSEMGFAILSGAGLFRASEKTMYVHTTSVAMLEDNIIDLTEALGGEKGLDEIDDNSPVFVMSMNHGSLENMITGFSVIKDPVTNKKKKLQLTNVPADAPTQPAQVFVDFYIEKTKGAQQMEIDAENFAGYYYVEASTLFRRQSDGKDLPAELIFPNVKVQSNFTFSMAATGDPSTFTFTMDAMPGYTRFDREKKVLCALQVIDEEEKEETLKGDSTATVASGEKKYPTSEVVLSEIPDENKATVTYLSKDGVYLIDKEEVKKGSTITLPEGPIDHSGVNEFKGWAATANAASGDGAGTQKVINEDTSFYATFGTPTGANLYE